MNLEKKIITKLQLHDGNDFIFIVHFMKFYLFCLKITTSHTKLDITVYMCAWTCSIDETFIK